MLKEKTFIKGIDNKDFTINPNDKLMVKLAMLIEAKCTIGINEAVKKYGYTRQRYYQLLKAYEEQGTEGLIDKKRGSTKRPVRHKELTNQIIRERFLDTECSSSVISQKMKQKGYNVSVRSIERTITEYGLQKKLINLTLKRKIKSK